MEGGSCSEFSSPALLFTFRSFSFVFFTLVFIFLTRDNPNSVNSYFIAANNFTTYDTIWLTSWYPASLRALVIDLCHRWYHSSLGDVTTTTNQVVQVSIGFQHNSHQLPCYGFDWSLGFPLDGLLCGIPCLNASPCTFLISLFGVRVLSVPIPRPYPSYLQ